MMIVTRDRTGYIVPIRCDTAAFAAKVRAGIDALRDTPDEVEIIREVESEPRDLRPIFAGGEPRGYASTSAHIRV